MVDLCKYIKIKQYYLHNECKINSVTPLLFRSTIVFSVFTHSMSVSDFNNSFKI